MTHVNDDVQKMHYFVLQYLHSRALLYIQSEVFP